MDGDRDVDRMATAIRQLLQQSLETNPVLEDEMPMASLDDLEHASCAVGHGASKLGSGATPEYVRYVNLLRGPVDGLFPLFADPLPFKLEGTMVRKGRNFEARPAAQRHV